MKRHLQRTALFTLYQSSVALGILLLPLALTLKRTIGVAPPIHRLLAATRRAYERTDVDASS